MPIRVTVWGENRHEQRDLRVRDLYPEGMHSAIRDGIVENLADSVTTRIDLLDDPEHGLSEEVKLRRLAEAKQDLLGRIRSFFALDVK